LLQPQVLLLGRSGVMVCYLTATHPPHQSRALEHLEAWILPGLRPQANGASRRARLRAPPAIPAKPRGPDFVHVTVFIPGAAK